MSTLNDSDLAATKHYWMACDYPERPDDGRRAYHIAITVEVGGDPGRVCKGCLIAAQAEVAIEDRDPFFVEAMLRNWVKDEP